MKSILCVMAIEALAPQVRTVVEVNNPAHVEHFQRADADEILVSSQLVSRLMARSSLYPGLAGLSPTSCPAARAPSSTGSPCPTSTSDSARRAVGEAQGPSTAPRCSRSAARGRHVNPPEDFRLEIGDDPVVVAESLGTLLPLQMDQSDDD